MLLAIKDHNQDLCLGQICTGKFWGMEFQF